MGNETPKYTWGGEASGERGCCPWIILETGRWW